MMNTDAKARSRAAASYHLKFREVQEYLEELEVLIRQDRSLQEAATAYRVKKCLDRIEEARKILDKASGILGGEKIEPSAKFGLLMPGQGDLL